MVGWYVQPDINLQLFVPIESVDLTARTITTGSITLGTTISAGTRFRIFAPPGVVRHQGASGTLSRFSLPQATESADGTRYLFAGYHYESPLAGMVHPTTSVYSHRQAGANGKALNRCCTQ
ncbi:MAG: hypothetical protein L3J82_09925 [Planctomycetes bacterium]|nr:hypothetical protein [Planctomycetota bacterium]